MNTELVFKEIIQIGKEDEGIFYIQKSTNKSSEEGNLRKTEVDKKFQGVWLKIFLKNW